MNDSGPIPQKMHNISPHLVCSGTANAIEFYKKAFGATELQEAARVAMTRPCEAANAGERNVSQGILS